MKKQKKKTEKEIVVKQEEQDYYMENGFVVFTASYHLKRGYCCESGCRHCPYQRSEDSGQRTETDDRN